MLKRKKILFVNGSLFGTESNTFSLVEKLGKFLSEYEIVHLNLSENKNHKIIVELIDEADGFIFGTGTYWQSWSSYLQSFFEEMVRYEGDKIWMNKPFCTVVTMHSIGGMDVASRIQSNLSLFGLVVPPMCCIVHSYVNTLLTKISDECNIWGERDLEIIANNLKVAIENKSSYQSWMENVIDEPHIRW